MMAENLIKLAAAEFAELNEVEARSLTDDIKGKAESLWSLLLTAHDRKAWKALGYENWDTYIRSEFAMGHSHSYRLLDQARVIKSITAAVEMSPMGDKTEPVILHVSERAARDIAPILPQVVERIRQETANVPRDVVETVVANVIREEREKQAAFSQGRAEMKALADELGLKPDPQGVADGQKVIELQEIIETVEAMPSPAEMAGKVKDYHRPYFVNIGAAIEWLQAFKKEIAL